MWPVYPVTGSVTATAGGPAQFPADVWTYNNGGTVMAKSNTLGEGLNVSGADHLPKVLCWSFQGNNML